MAIDHEVAFSPTLNAYQNDFGHIQIQPRSSHESKKEKSYQLYTQQLPKREYYWLLHSLPKAYVFVP